jgi:fatty-acyl-CoA synthase
MIITNSEVAAAAVLGCWASGAVVASLPERAVGTDLEVYRDQLERICVNLNPALVLASEDVVAELPPSFVASGAVVAVESVSGAESMSPRCPAENSPAFIQYSSGSTGTPKGCVLTGAAIGRHLDMLSAMTSPQPGESGVSWAPFSHDMGFFGGFMSGLWNDVATYYSTPQRFRLSPRTWLEDLARYGAAHTTTSPTALQVAARVMTLRKRELPGSLAGIKCMIIGAERVTWDVIADAIESLGPYGLEPSAMMPAYGLAEGTLAVTATALDAEPRYVSVDALALGDGRVVEVDDHHPNASRVVSCGEPIDGVTLVPGPPGQLAPVVFSSPALAQGYFDDPETTALRFRDDNSFDTGDLGFVKDGALYPVGRSDDMIPVGGRNVYVRELEAKVENSIDGLRNGCTALIDTAPDATARRLVFIVEIGGKGHDHKQIGASIGMICRANAALTIDEIVFVPRRSLPRTPSGKIQRHRCRVMVNNIAGGFTIVDRVVLAALPESQPVAVDRTPTSVD